MPENLTTPVAWRPGAPLAFETERFRLRSMATGDITDAYISWWNDEEIQAGLGMPVRGWGRPQAERHVSNFDNRGRFHLGIYVKSDDSLIGFFAMFIERHKVARTNIVIGDKSYWGHGVPLEVRARGLEILFGLFKMDKVYGKLHVRNYPSIFNYKALHFTCEAILRQHEIGPDGERRDMLMFGLLRDEWEARRATEEPA